MRVGGVGGGTGGPTREPLLFCNKDDHGIKNGWIAESHVEALVFLVPGKRILFQLVSCFVGRGAFFGARAPE
jgi:hypothetical protein